MNDAEWLALLLRSEANLQHEWWPVGWVVRNRVESEKFPDTYEGVILQRMQFSYFNGWTSAGIAPDRIFVEAQRGYAGPTEPLSLACAKAILATPRWHAPFGRAVLNYWSPVSMLPQGSLPAWDFSHLRCFELSGIDPYRFIFGETVKVGHPLAGSRSGRFEFLAPPPVSGGV